MSKKTLIIVIVAVLLLVGGAVAGTLFFTGAFSAGHGKAEAAANAAPAAEEGHGSGEDKSKEAKPAEETKPAEGGSEGHAGDGKSPLFHALDPAFVVNIDDGAATRFLQVQVEVKVRSAAVSDAIDRYQPRIRNDLIMLFSATQRDLMRTPEGRAQLQKQTLDTINAALQAETGQPGVIAVYFTKLVIQ